MKTDHDDDALLALLYDELPPTEAEALRRRLAKESPESLDRLAQWQRVRTLAAELPVLEPDPQMRYDLVRAARLAAEPEEKPSRWWAWVEKLSWAPAFAGLLLVVAAAGLTARLTRDIGEGAPAADTAPVTTKGAAEKGAGEKKADAKRSAKESTFDKSAEAAAQAKRRRLAEAREPPADMPVAAVEAAPEGTAALEAEAAEEPDAPAPSSADGVIGGAPGRGPVALDNAASGRAAKSAEPARDAEAAKAGVRSADRAKKAKAVSKLDFAPPPPAKPSPSRKQAATAETVAEPFPEPNAAPADKPTREASVDDALADLGGATGGDRAEEPRVVALDGVQQGGGYAPPPPPATPTETTTALKAEAAFGDTAAANEDAVDAVVEAPARRRAARGETRAPQAAAAPQATAPPAAQPAVEEKAADEMQRGGGGDVLTRARRASGAGDDRTAVVLYEEYLSENRGAGGLDRVWYETAQSYERLGRGDRAIALYRLVAAGQSPYAEPARRRIEALVPPQAQQTGPPKQTAPAAPARAYDFDEAAVPAEGAEAQ